MIRAVRIVAAVDLDRDEGKRPFGAGLYAFRIAAAAGAHLSLAFNGVEGYAASELLFTNLQAATAVIDAEASVPVHGHIAHAGKALFAVACFDPMKGGGRTNRLTRVLLATLRPFYQLAVLADVDKIHKLKAHGPDSGKLQIDRMAGLFRCDGLHMFLGTCH